MPMSLKCVKITKVLKWSAWPEMVWKKRVVSELLSPGKGNSTEAHSLQEATLKRFQCFGDTETFSGGGENWGQQILRFCITNNALSVFDAPIKQHNRSLMSLDSPALPRSYLHPLDTLPLRNSCVTEALVCSRPGTADAAWPVGQRTAWAGGGPHPARWQAHPPCHQIRCFWLRPRCHNSPLPGSLGQCHRLGTPTSQATSQQDSVFWVPRGRSPTDAARVWKCCRCRKTQHTPVARKKSHHRSIPLPKAGLGEVPLED